MAYPILKHLAYNEWANEQIAEMLIGIEDRVYIRRNKNSFPSVAKTIMHIWDAQDIWLKRMNGVTPDTWPSAAFQGPKEDALNGVVQSSNELFKFVESKNEKFLTSMYVYKNMAGIEFEDSYEETLFHVVNHGTYHRGQIISMLREASVTNIVSTDLIYYLRTLKK